MELEKEENVCTIWINWERRILSFHAEEGVTQRQFPTREEMFRFSVERTMEGFAIQ